MSFHRIASRSFHRPFCLACIITLATLVAAAASVLLSASARAQEPAPPQPTKEHEMLKREAGEWEAAGKFYIPGMDAIESNGEETSRMIGDLWLVSHYKDASGFEGHGTLGYDTDKKKFVGTWVDTMSTSVHTMEGDYDAAKKTMTIFMTAKDQTGKLVKQRHVTVYKSDDARDFTIYMPGEDGKEIKILEIAYKRKKASK